MSRVVLAMSGGVDSSVAAWLLRESGHDVVGVFMGHGRPFDSVGDDSAGDDSAGCGQGCCGAADAADARRVADVLGIPFYVLNFEKEFGRIIEYFVEAYTAGRTPNPCVVCNARLKFGKLLEYADSIDADYVATGHYARLVRQHDGRIDLCRGRDASKDQSYALFGIKRQVLPRLRLPVGDHHKDEIRAIAGRLGLRVADKPDSQELCFVTEGNHVQLVRTHRGEVDTSGEVVTTGGIVVGEHDGFERFTVGQRKGLRIAMGEPYYVVRIEAESHRVVIGTRDDLARDELTADGANWLVEPPGGPLRCQVKIRYRSRAEEATVEPFSADRFRVRFDRPRHGVAPGQAAVCYQGDRVLGGGWIE